MQEKIKDLKKMLIVTLAILIAISGLVPSLSTPVKAAPSTISGTAHVKCTGNNGDWHNAFFDVTINGKVYKGKCLDPILAPPLDGNYSYTGTLQSDGSYYIVVNSKYTAHSYSQVHKIAYGHINVPFPVLTQRVGGFYLKTTGKVQLIKTTKNNNHLVKLCPEQYSLKGAKYGVYSDSSATKKIGELITDSTGKSNILSNINAGTYYIKETVAPKGYMLDKKIYKVTVSAGKTATVKVADEPILDPLRWKAITKKVEAGADKNLSVEGAEYTVKYYKEFLNQDNIGDKTPFRTWIFLADKNGDVKWEDGYLKEGSKPLFKNDNGKASGLAGIYSIEETNAPQGLAKDNKIVYVKVEIIGDNIKRTFSEKPVFDNSTIVMEDGTAWNQEEKTQKVNLHIQKKDAETGENEAQGYGTLAGAIFEIFHFDPLTAEDKKVGEITTDENGKGSLNGLKPGLYKIVEKTAPKGYLKNDTIFEVKAGIKELNTAFFDYFVDVKETPTTVELTKVKGNGTGFEALAGAKLQLFDDTGKELETWVSESEAKVIKGLEIGKTYTVKELEAPKGYNKRANDLKFTVKDTAEVQKYNILNEAMPKIESNATFKDNQKRGNYGKNILIDKVTLSNLLTEDEAKMLGENQTSEYTYTMQAISADSGKVVNEQTKTFTSNAKTKELEFTVNMDNLAIGEEIYFTGKLTRTGADFEVKHNEDNTDLNQIVQAWRIKTKLLVSSTINDKEVSEDKVTKTKDVIEYVKYDKYIGQTVIVKSVLMDKTTKKPFIDKDGKEVKAETKVEIEKTDGKFEVVFPEFNSTSFEGDLVCFEEVYDKDGNKIDEHKDFNDKDQTIKISAKPKIIKTIDNNSNLIYVLLMTGALTIIIRQKFKNKNN